VHPELLRIGPLVLRSYGLFMALGFALGITVLVLRGRARGLPAVRMVDLSLVMVVTGMLGGRLLYALTHASEFAREPWRVLWPVQADGSLGLQGFVYYGGIGLALPVAAWLVRRWRLDPWTVLDAGAPALALGTAVGRLGCFLNGCCFGHPTEGWCGMVFPPASQAGSVFPGTPIHPTQLYIAADNLLIAVVLLFIERRGGRFDGALIGTYLVLTGLTRWFEDLFRYYESSMVVLRGVAFDLTVNHLIGLVLVVVGVVIIITGRKRGASNQDRDGGSRWSRA